MINKNKGKLIAEKLLEIKAVSLRPNEPFTWASGKLSPIYCDNRKTLSFADVRTIIKEAFVAKIKTDFPEVSMIAGVATAGIPHGALIADAMNLPFIYVRSKPKGHGLQNLIEGKIQGGEKIVVIEDLISTGMSSLKAVDALKAENCSILGLGAIFTYGFPQSKQAFETANIPYFTLTDFDELIQIAIDENYIDASTKDALLEWKIS